MHLPFKKSDRYASARDNEQVLRLWVRDEGYPAMFTIDKLRIVGKTGDRVSISLQLMNGTWIGSPSLPPGRYNMSDWAMNIVEMRLRGAEGSQSVATVDDVQIRRLFVVE